MTRRIKQKKSVAPVIPNWAHADAIIERVGTHQRTIEDLRRQAQTDIDIIKDRMQKQIDQRQNSIALYLQSLEMFCEQHRDDFGRAKSKKLTFGTIGWRFSSRIIIKPKKTLELIKTMLSASFRKQCIKVKESVDKNALANLTDEVLAEVQARRQEKDVFFVEPASVDEVDHRTKRNDNSTGGRVPAGTKRSD